MYEELVKRLRTRNGWALNKTLDEAADAIEELSKLAEAIPPKCECCIGCEIEKKNGGCDTGFVLSPERAKAYIEENLDWWRKFRALMEAMGTPIPEPPKEEKP